MMKRFRHDLLRSSSMLALVDLASPEWDREQSVHRMNFQIMVQRAEQNPYDYGNNSNMVQ